MGGNKFRCSRCGIEFELDQEKDTEFTEDSPIRCPGCGTSYIRRIFTFPRGYSSRPHG